MRLELGRKGAYSIDAVVYLARQPGPGRSKARAIGEAIGAPGNYLPQILADLVRGGILVAEAGREGGYRLARRAEAITLLELVEAAEGPIVEDRCQLTGKPLVGGSVCLLHESWARVCGGLIRELRRTTVADLALPRIEHSAPRGVRSAADPEAAAAAPAAGGAAQPG